MPEAWYKEECLECETVNWICNGDEQDLSGIDVEGFKCRKCGHINCFDESVTEEEKENCNWELGKETPN